MPEWPLPRLLPVLTSYPFYLSSFPLWIEINLSLCSKNYFSKSKTVSLDLNVPTGTDNIKFKMPHSQNDHLIWGWSLSSLLEIMYQVFTEILWIVSIFIPFFVNCLNMSTWLCPFLCIVFLLFYFFSSILLLLKNVHILPIISYAWGFWYLIFHDLVYFLLSSQQEVHMEGTT